MLWWFVLLVKYKVQYSGDTYKGLPKHFVISQIAKEKQLDYPGNYLSLSPQNPNQTFNIPFP